MSERAAYDRQREQARQRMARLTLVGQDIGELPPVADKERRKGAERDFQRFCESYLAETFDKPWSSDHLVVISKIEATVLHGELFALAMPRGSGKTSLCEAACLWSILYGHRHFVMLIGADETSSLEMLQSIKSELENNDLLLQDFPESCYPIVCLDGSTRKAEGQKYRGKRTQINWTKTTLVMPTVEGSPASQAIIRTRGITGRIRGQKFKRANGTAARPDLAIIDDPQTDESAKSEEGSDYRERILNGAVLGLAGPGKKIAGIMPCTVIREGDMAYRMLDQATHPRWKGEKMKMVYDWPKRQDLWDRYAEIVAEDQAKATAFYRKHRKDMDDGAKVAWQDRFNDDELSAIQHAWNLRLRDEATFFAEYQNEPLNEEDTEGLLTADEIARKVNGLKRYEVSQAVNAITAFVDVQEKCLYYVVCAWEDDFSGYVIDYGTYPDQKLEYFRLRNIRHTLAKEAKGAGFEGALMAGLEAISDQLCGRTWTRDDGSQMRIDRLLIDSGWQRSRDTVEKFCRNTKHSMVMPSRGVFIGPAQLPFNEHKKQIGEKIGFNWRIPTNRKQQQLVRYVLYDTNFWKTFVQTRLAVQFGDPGSLTLWKARPNRHRLFADQMAAEFRTRTEGRGRVVDVWELRPNGFDNHWLDGVVGCAVGASMSGISLAEHQGVKKSKPAGQRRRLSDLRNRKR